MIHPLGWYYPAILAVSKAKISFTSGNELWFREKSKAVGWAVEQDPLWETRCKTKSSVAIRLT
jgi:hypothetical protein